MSKMPIPESWQPLLAHPCCTTPAKLERWKKKFFLPSYAITRLPRSSHYAFSNHSKEVTVFRAQLKAGLRYPPPKMVCEFCKFHGIAVNQLPPNSFCYFNAYLCMCGVFGIEPHFIIFMQYYKLSVVPKGGFYFMLPRGSGSKKFMFTFATKDSWRGWQQKFFFLKMDEAWSYVPTKWAQGTLDVDVVDPRMLLTPELAPVFADFDARIRAVSDWDPEVAPRALYPFPINWKLMTEEVLRELKVVKEHETDLKMPAPAIAGKDSWLVKLLKEEISFEALAESELSSTPLLFFPRTYADVSLLGLPLMFLSYFRDGRRHYYLLQIPFHWPS